MQCLRAMGRTLIFGLREVGAMVGSDHRIDRTRLKCSQAPPGCCGAEQTGSVKDGRPGQMGGN